MTSSLNGLAALEQQIQADFEYLNIGVKDWVIDPHHPEQYRLNVAIIGAGMSALALALALRAQGVACTLFEKADQGNEGPWLSPALMQTLRSPKNAIGPALISPSLSFQAWFKAQFGLEAWQQLDKIPRIQWHEYLQWFKQVTAPDIRYQHELVDLELQDHGATLTFSTAQGQVSYFAAHTVLATGMEAFSVPNIPEFIRDIPSAYWEHSYAGTDYARFQDLDVGVVGYSAGAMDSAATALEHGARSVELLCRCQDFPRVNRGKVASNAGYLQSYSDWTDAQKWHFHFYVQQQRTPAPHGSTLRVSRHDNAYFNLNSTVQKVELIDQKLYVYTKQECFVLDYLILATGFCLDWQKHAWTAKLQPYFKQWQDVYHPPEHEQSSELARQPYLGAAFEFQEKQAGQLAGLSRLYAFNFSAGLSHGPLVGMIGGTHHGAEVLAQAIVRKIYQDQFDEHLQQVKHSTEYELEGDEWQVAKPYATRAAQRDEIDA